MKKQFFLPVIFVLFVWPVSDVCAQVNKSLLWQMDAANSAADPVAARTALLLKLYDSVYESKNNLMTRTFITGSLLAQAGYTDFMSATEALYLSKWKNIADIDAILVQAPNSSEQVIYGYLDWRKKNELTKENYPAFFPPFGKPYKMTWQ